MESECRSLGIQFRGSRASRFHFGILPPANPASEKRSHELVQCSLETLFRGGVASISSADDLAEGFDADFKSHKAFGLFADTVLKLKLDVAVAATESR